MGKLKKSPHWLVFIIQPFLTLVFYGFKRFREPYAKNIMWAFIVFFGLTFAIGDESTSSDIVRYVKEIKNLYGHSMSWDLGIRYFLSTGEIDVLRTILALLLSRITDSQIFVTAAYAFIFGYFYSRNMWFVIDRLRGKLKKMTILLLVCIFLMIPIWNLGGFRFWTASHVFIFGLLPYLVENNKKKLWISFCAVLVHFSFVLPVVVLLTFLLLGNRLKAYFIAFIISFFISSINIGTVNNFVQNQTPKIFQERTSSYRSEETVSEYRHGSGKSEKNWYARFYGKALYWSVVFLLVLIYFGFDKRKYQSNALLTLFSFVLLFYTFGNLMSSFPSGGRFLKVANLFGLAFLTIYFQNNSLKLKLKRRTMIVIPFLVLFIVISIREGFYFVSTNTLLGNPITAIWVPEFNVSLNDIIK